MDYGDRIDENYRYFNNPSDANSRKSTTGLPTLQEVIGYHGDQSMVEIRKQQSFVVFLHPLHKIAFLNEACSEDKPGKESDDHHAVNKRSECRCPSHCNIEQID